MAILPVTTSALLASRRNSRALMSFNKSPFRSNNKLIPSPFNNLSSKRSSKKSHKIPKSPPNPNRKTIPDVGLARRKLTYWELSAIANSLSATSTECLKIMLATMITLNSARNYSSKTTPWYKRLSSKRFESNKLS